MMNMANVKDRFFSAVLIIFLAISTTDVQGKSLSLRIISVKGESPCQTGLIHEEDAFVVTGHVTTENINASDSQRVQFTIVGTNFEATVCTVRLSSCHEQDSSYMGCYCQNTGDGEYDVVLRQKANVQYSTAKVKLDYKDDDFSFEMSSTSWRIPETFYKDTEKLKLEANGIKVDLTSSHCTLPLREGQNTFMYCCSDAPSCDVRITEPDGRESGSIGCYKLTAYGIDESLHYAFSYSVCGVESSQSYTCKGKFAPELFPTSPPPPPLDHDADDEEVSKEPVGIGIILGVVAAVIVPLVIILGVCFYCKRHGNKIGCCPEKGNSKDTLCQNEMGQGALPTSPPPYTESQYYDNGKTFSNTSMPFSSEKKEKEKLRKHDNFSSYDNHWDKEPTYFNALNGNPSPPITTSDNANKTARTSDGQSRPNGTDKKHLSGYKNHTNNSMNVYSDPRGTNSQLQVKVNRPGHGSNSNQDTRSRSDVSDAYNGHNRAHDSYQGNSSGSNGTDNDLKNGNAYNDQRSVCEKDQGKERSNGKASSGTNPQSETKADNDQRKASSSNISVNDNDQGKVKENGIGSSGTDQQSESNTDGPLCEGNSDQGSGSSGDSSGNDKDKDSRHAYNDQSSDSDNGKGKVEDSGKSGSGIEPQSETSDDRCGQKNASSRDASGSDKDRSNANSSQNSVSCKVEDKVESNGTGSSGSDQQPKPNTVRPLHGSNSDQGSGDSGDGSGIDKDKDRTSACNGQSSDIDNSQGKEEDSGKSDSGIEPQSETSTDEGDLKPESKTDRLDHVDDSDQGSGGSGGSSGIDKDNGNANSGQSCVNVNNQVEVDNSGKGDSSPDQQSETKIDRPDHVEVDNNGKGGSGTDQQLETKINRPDHVDDSDQGSGGNGDSSGIDKDKDNGNANKAQSSFIGHDQVKLDNHGKGGSGTDLQSETGVYNNDQRKVSIINISSYKDKSNANSGQSDKNDGKVESDGKKW